MSADDKESEQPACESKQGSSCTRHLRALIRNCTDFPSEVSESDFARVDKRKIDESLLKLLTEHSDPNCSDQALAAATQRRFEALSPYLDRTLICVLIKLPGVTYTIEIDPVDDCIVHWEWQTT